MQSYLIRFFGFLKDYCYESCSLSVIHVIPAIVFFSGGAFLSTQSSYNNIGAAVSYPTANKVASREKDLL